MKKQKPRKDFLGWLGTLALFVITVFILISDNKKEKMRNECRFDHYQIMSISER